MAKKRSKNPKVRKRQLLRDKLKEVRKQIRALEKIARGYEEEIRKLSKMRKGGGAPKGKRFEREVAKILVKEFGKFGITQEDCFRTPMSGGHRFASKKDPGDLQCSKKLRKIFPFSVECKSYKDIDMFPFWEKEKKRKRSWTVNDWLAQTIAATPKNGSMYPMLVFKKNKSVQLVAIPQLLPLTAHCKHKLPFWYKGQQWFVLPLTEVLKVLVTEAERGR